MLDYIKENCQLPPLEEEPLYDNDSQTWDLYFDEKECSWFPYPDAQLISISYETKDEAIEDMRAIKQIMLEEEQKKIAEEKARLEAKKVEIEKS